MNCDVSMCSASDIEDDPATERNNETPSEDLERMARIQESRRKMAELEADRPIWEQAAREREERERAEAAWAEERAELRRRKKHELDKERERLKKQREETESRQRPADDRRRAAQESDHRQRQSRQARWGFGRWTDVQALEKFRELCNVFDTARFSQDRPLRVIDVPWPTLKGPDSFTLHVDVTWESVEHFFAILKKHTTAQEYITMIEQSHRRFHSDRWRSRGLFTSVRDPQEREWMEAGTLAENLVHTQALI